MLKLLWAHVIYVGSPIRRVILGQLNHDGDLTYEYVTDYIYDFQLFKEALFISYLLYMHMTL